MNGIIWHNNAIHSDGQGLGVLSFYNALCLITFYKNPSTLPTGDGGRWATKNWRKMRKGDYFLNYTAEDLEYELGMLVRCKIGITDYSDNFLQNLCLEGWLLHARRIIEVFHLDALDKKWKVRWGLISEHLSHANPSNRKDPRAEKRENPQWDVETYHCELIGALETVAEQHKFEFPQYDLLINILKAAKGVEVKREMESSFTGKQL